MEFPRMVYRVGTAVELESGRYDTRIVDADEFGQAQADGWHLDQYAAKDAHIGAVSGTQPTAGTAPPTRAELEEQATKLGIKFDGRTADAKLASKIEAAMKG